MHITKFVFNHFQVNCYLLWDESTKACAIVDPAAEASYEEAQLTQFIEEKGLHPEHILLTHAHIDHVAGLRSICERYPLPVTLHEDGNKLLRQAEAYASVMGFEVGSLADLPTRHIQGGDRLTLAGRDDLAIECRYVPGHCPGSICYYLPAEAAVLTGDALFYGSVGRTDLPGGDPQLLIAKIKEQLLPLPDDTVVLPGHGPDTTIGEERRENGFLL